MRIAFLVIGVLALGAGLVTGGEELADRVSKLIERWSNGDEAAKAGVVAEAKALGDEALTELFRRLEARRDFPGVQLGIVPGPVVVQQRSDRLVSLEMRYADASELGLKADGGARVLSGKEAAEVEAGKPDTISAPRLTTYDGQRANVTIISETRYVSGYDAKGNPTLGTVQTGVVTEVRATVGAKRETVRLVLRLQRAELALPVEELKTPAGPVQIPDIVKRETALTLSVKAGARTKVLLPGTNGIKPLVLTVKADPVELEDVEFPGQDIDLEPTDRRGG